MVDSQWLLSEKQASPVLFLLSLYKEDCEQSVMDVKILDMQ